MSIPIYQISIDFVKCMSAMIPSFPLNEHILVHKEGMNDAYSLFQRTFRDLTEYITTTINDNIGLMSSREIRTWIQWIEFVELRWLTDIKPIYYQFYTITEKLIPSLFELERSCIRLRNLGLRCIEQLEIQQTLVTQEQVIAISEELKIWKTTFLNLSPFEQPIYEFWTRIRREENKKAQLEYRVQAIYDYMNANETSSTPYLSKNGMLHHVIPFSMFRTSTDLDMVRTPSETDSTRNWHLHFASEHLSDLSLIVLVEDEYNVHNDPCSKSIKHFKDNYYLCSFILENPIENVDRPPSKVRLAISQEDWNTTTTNDPFKGSFYIQSYLQYSFSPNSNDTCVIFVGTKEEQLLLLC